jgi:hypothetical protein
MLPAQSTNSSLRGQVTDPSEATTRESQVAAIKNWKNLLYKATSNSSVEYFLTNLVRGAYRIDVEMPGFHTLIQPDVALHVQDAQELKNVIRRAFYRTVGRRGA